MKLPKEDNWGGYLMKISVSLGWGAFVRRMLVENAREREDKVHMTV